MLVLPGMRSPKSTFQKVESATVSQICLQRIRTAALLGTLYIVNPVVEMVQKHLSGDVIGSITAIGSAAILWQLELGDGIDEYSPLGAPHT